jgi:hypothetical protein
MITAVRYITASDGAPLHGAPLVRPLRIFYNLPKAEVVSRLEQALAEGREGVQVEDVAGALRGRIREKE